MLQVNNGSPSPFKIKSIRKADESGRIPGGSACSLEAGEGTDKSPC
jgi:hypothetical protein